MQPYGFTHPDFAPCTHLVEKYGQALQGTGIAGSKAKALAWEYARTLEQYYLEHYPDAPPMTEFEEKLALLALQLDGLSHKPHPDDVGMDVSVSNSDLRCSAMADGLMGGICFYAGRWVLRDMGMGLRAGLLLLWGRLTEKNSEEEVRPVWAPWIGRAPPPYGPQVILRQ